jgi:hypothetical protein
MSTVEDPIYAIARKRKRDWQVIAQQVSKTKPRGPATPVAKPYNLRGGGLPAPGSTIMPDGDFHETQRGMYCGMHAIHNLFRENTWPTIKEMNILAEKVAKEAGDKVLNHKSYNGYYSSDVIVRVMQDRGFIVRNMVKQMRGDNGNQVWLWDHDVGTMHQLLNDDKVLGFIIHQPQHYTALRKNLDKSDWQYSNSYSKQSNYMNPHEFCKQALNGVWTVWCVSKK